MRPSVAIAAGRPTGGGGETKLREVEVAAEQVKLALEAIFLKESRTLERFYAAVRKATTQVQVLAERYGGDVSFSFDSNGRSVWVVALFGKGAPPIDPSRRRESGAPPQDERNRSGERRLEG